MQYLYGNFIYFTQGTLGFYCITDGGCAGIDAMTCVNPVAKPFFIAGSALNIGAGTCMVASFALGYVCVPAAVGVGIVGTACRRIGSYAVKTANSLEMKPTLTKATSSVGLIADLADFI